MRVAVLNAERIKLSTTRSPLWSAVAVAVLSLGLAAIQASTVYGPGPLAPEKAAMGVAIFGVPVLMILSALTVTNEYRSGMIRTTFMTVPNRSLVLVAKAIVAAVFSGAFAAADGHGVDRGGAIPTRTIGGWSGQSRCTRCSRRFWASASVRCCGPRPARLRCSCCGPWSRNRYWETCPTSVRRSGPYLPFANAFTFMGVQWLYPYYAMPWGELGSIVYFAAVTAVVFVAALVDRQPA